MKEFEWADLHPYMTDVEMDEYIRQIEKEEEEKPFFYRPL